MTITIIGVATAHRLSLVGVLSEVVRDCERSINERDVNQLLEFIQFQVHLYVLVHNQRRGCRFKNSTSGV